MRTSAGCSIQDELFLSFEQILAVGDRNKVRYCRCDAVMLRF